MTKSILITGASGYIGSFIEKRSLNLGWKITCLSLKKKIIKKKNINYLFFDISKKNLIEKNLKNKKFDYVINCAGYVDHKNKKKVFQTHYKGCKNLVDYFLKSKKKIKTFIQLGSSVEYGDLAVPHKESLFDKIKHTNSFYGDAKLMATKYLLNAYNKYKFPCKIFRIYLCYGPGQNLNRFIPIVIDACKKNKKFDCSNGLQVRDFIYIDDLINLIFQGLKDKKFNGNIFNAGSGQKIKLRNAIQYIKKVFKGGKPDYGKIKLRKDEKLIFYGDISDAKKKLKWKPQIRFHEGIKKIFKIYKNI